MAQITTNNNYITILCPKCGKELKVDTSTGLSNGINYWHDYDCPHCGYRGSIDDDRTLLEHRAYTLDEIREIIKKKQPIPVTPLREENSLERIADTLDDIKDLLKELLENEEWFMGGTRKNRE